MSDKQLYGIPKIRSRVEAHAHHRGWDVSWPEGQPAFRRMRNVKTLGDLRRTKPPSEIDELDGLLDSALERDGGDD